MADTDIFQPFIQKLIQLGFYNFFFPWLITTALMYGLLKKSKVLGESNFYNGVVALTIAFLVIGFPQMFGNPSFFALPLSAFFTQATVIILFLGFGFLIASLFYPNLTSWLPTVFKHRSTLAIMIALALALFITSGLVQVLWSGFGPTGGGQKGGTPIDVIIIAAGVIIFVILLIIASSVVRGGE